MAGDWLKFELETPDKPEVMELAQALGVPRTQVIGCLILVWRWFNRQTLDGHAPVTLAALSEIAGLPGFAEAMKDIHWLSTGTKDGKITVSVPSFDIHNGKSAKKRALESKRAQRYRNALVTPASRKQRDQEKEVEVDLNPLPPLRKSRSSQPQAQSTIPPGSIRCRKCSTISGDHCNGLCRSCWREDQGLPATH